MKNGLDINIRNCGGKYPNSSFNENGFIIGSLEIRQCPKTFINQKAIGLIDLYDFHAKFNPSDFKFGEAPSWFIDLSKVIEETRSQIRELKFNIDNQRGPNI